MNAKLSYRLAAASVLLLGALTASSARAGDGRWTPTGPGGGVVYSLAIDTENSSILHAVTKGGLYRSADGGVSWVWVADVGGCCTGAVVVDPAHPEVVYAGGNGFLKRSEDRGRTWTTVLSTPPQSVRTLLPRAVVPGDPSTVFASDSGRLLWSHDDGRTWERNPFDRDGVLNLAVHPRNPAILYMASLSGLFKSVDGGRTWTSLHPPVVRSEDGDFRAVTLAPSSPETVYLATSEGRFFRSRDGGGSWTAFPGFGFVHELAVDPRDPATVWAAASLGVWVSRDAGESWKPANRGMPFDRRGLIDRDVRTLVVDPSSPEILYAGLGEFGGAASDGGVAKSTNGGRSWWIEPQRGLSGAHFGFVRFDPSVPGAVYAGLVRMPGVPVTYWRIVRSLDGGRRWEPFAERLGALGDLAFDPAAPGVVIAAGEEGVWRSADGGASWRRLSRLDGRPVFRLAVAARGTILAAGGCGLWRSADRGRTWRQVLPCGPNPPGSEYPAGVEVRDFAVDPSSPRRVYARVILPDAPGGMVEWLLRSGDAGETWRIVRDGGPLAIAPMDPRVLYLGRLNPVDGYELLRSEDRGGTWTLVTTPDRPFEALAVASWDPDTVYAAVPGRGVLRSTDGGATWAPLHNGLARMDRLDVRGVVLDPWHPGRLFTWGADKGGLFELRDPEAPGGR